MALQPSRIETLLLEAPIANPVRNSFRTLIARPALLLRITDADGATGWGEIWCNYPRGVLRIVRGCWSRSSRR